MPPTPSSSAFPCKDRVCAVGFAYVKDQLKDGRTTQDTLRGTVKEQTLVIAQQKVKIAEMEKGYRFKDFVDEAVDVLILEEKVKAMETELQRTVTAKQALQEQLDGFARQKDKEVLEEPSASQDRTLQEQRSQLSLPTRTKDFSTITTQEAQDLISNNKTIHAAVQREISIEVEKALHKQWEAQQPELVARTDIEKHLDTRNKNQAKELAISKRKIEQQKAEIEKHVNSSREMEEEKKPQIHQEARNDDDKNKTTESARTITPTGTTLDQPKQDTEETRLGHDVPLKKVFHRPNHRGGVKKNRRKEKKIREVQPATTTSNLKRAASPLNTLKDQPDPKRPCPNPTVDASNPTDTQLPSPKTRSSDTSVLLPASSPPPLKSSSPNPMQKPNSDRNTPKCPPMLRPSR